MKTIALLRLSESGKYFDLKFSNPQPNHHSIFTKFIQENYRVGSILNNFSCRLENRTTIGYESRVHNSQELCKLIDWVKIFCEKQRIKFQQGTIPKLKTESFVVAKS